MTTTTRQSSKVWIYYSAILVSNWMLKKPKHPKEAAGYSSSVGDANVKNEMACLIAKSLASIGPGTKVPFSKLAEFKQHHDDEVSAEPSAAVYQAALELGDAERMQVNHNGPKHLLPELYEELVDIEAVSSAISEQKSMVEKLQTQIKQELEKSGKTSACESMREDHKKAAQRLKQPEDAKGKTRSTTQVQYYFGKMGFGRRYAYTRGEFSYQGASRLVRKILAGRFYCDIDIVNCYPVLLWHLLSNMEVNVGHIFPALHTAVFKRKEMIDAIMVVFQCEHDKAKRLPSVLINGGSIHGTVGWCAENGLNSQHAECTIVGKLHEECQEAIALFTEQFPDHKAKPKEVFPNKSPSGSTTLHPSTLNWNGSRTNASCQSNRLLRRKAAKSAVSSLMAVYSGSSRVWAAPKSIPYCSACKKMLRRMWV